MDILRNLNISDKKLGSGSYGSVFQATMLYKGIRRDVAVKKIPNDGEHYAENARREHEVLRRLGTHGNIVELINVASDRHYIHIIMEFAALGDLDKYVENRMPELREKIKIMRECSAGVHFMHSLQPQVIHRDIKPGNILLQSSTEGPIAKICDFGMSRIFDSEGAKQFMSTYAGTIMYQAPEQFTKGRRQYTAAVDVFSLGLVYMGLLNINRDKPQIDSNPESLYESDMLPYAQHLKMALQYKAPLPALFTLTSADKWPTTEIKALVTHMAAFEAADRIKIGDVETTLRAVLSAYDSNTSSAVAQCQNQVEDLNTAVTSNKQEVSALKSQLSDVSVILQENEDILQRNEIENSELKSQLSDVSVILQEKEDILQRNEIENSELKSQLSDVSVILQEKEDILQRNEIENSELKSQLSNVSSILQENEDVSQKNEIEISQLKSQLQENDTTMERNYQRIKDFESQLAAVSLQQAGPSAGKATHTPTRPRQVKGKNMSEGTSRQSAVKTKMQVSVILQENEGIIQRNENENSELKSQLSNVSSILAAFEAADRIKIGDVTAYDSNTKSAVAQCQNQAGDLNMAVSRKDQEISDLKSQLSDVSVILQENEDILQRNEIENSELKSQLSDVSVILQEKEDILQRNEIENSELKSQLSNVSSILQENEDVSQRNEIEISQLKSQLQENDTTLGRKEQLIKDFESQLAADSLQQPGPFAGKPTPTARHPRQMKGENMSEGTSQQSAVKTRTPANATHRATSPGTSATLSSFRNNVPSLHTFSSHSPTLVKTFLLRNYCHRLCFYNDSIYCCKCCSYSKDCIDVYTLEGKFSQSISLGEISRPFALHPLSAGRLVLAAKNGLFIMGDDGGDINCIKQGNFEDVHVNDNNIVALKNYNSDGDISDISSDSSSDSESDSVCVLSSTAPYTQTAAFTLGHTRAFTVLLHQDTVYVSDRHTHQVTGYRLTGEQLSQWGGEGRGGGPGELYYPRLCATDSSGRVLVADQGNGRFQVVTAGGQWAVVPGVEVRSPTDVILLTDRMWVLHGYGHREISVYKI